MTVSRQTITDPVRKALLASCMEVIRSREPDFTAGDRYMERWRLAPYGDNANIYIHRFRGDDEDGALHDHPYDNVSFVLQGSYHEHLHCEPLVVQGDKYKTFSVVRRPGDVITRGATVAHRLSMVDDEVITMFTTGPRVREWGFHCVSGWIHFKDFLTENGGRKGCP